MTPQSNKDEVKKLLSLYPPIKFVDIENMEARLEDEQGERERITVWKIDLTFQMHILSSYTLAYFILLFFIAFVLSAQNYDSISISCSIAFVPWYKICAITYVVFVAAATVLFVKIKSSRNQVERVNLGWFELLFLSF